MTEQLNRFGMGARFVPAEILSETDLGPLKQLVGEWFTRSTAIVGDWLLS